jgi:hypothetical protein
VRLDRAEKSAMELFVKVQSHRQRSRAYSVLGGHRQCYYSFQRNTGRGVFKVTAEEYRALKDRGRKCTRLHAPHDDLRECVSFA